MLSLVRIVSGGVATGPRMHGSRSAARRIVAVPVASRPDHDRRTTEHQVLCRQLRSTSYQLISADVDALDARPRSARSSAGREPVAAPRAAARAGASARSRAARRPQPRRVLLGDLLELPARSSAWARRSIRRIVSRGGAECQQHAGDPDHPRQASAAKRSRERRFLGQCARTVRAVSPNGIVRPLDDPAAGRSWPACDQQRKSSCSGSSREYSA